MKYIRIQTSQGSVYLNKHTRKVYMFPPFVPKLSYCPNIIMILSSAIFFLIPYLFLRSFIDVETLIALLCGITFAIVICILFSWKERDSFFDHLSQAAFTSKPDYRIKELFKKQVLQTFKLSVFIIFLYSIAALVSYWLVNDGEPANYGFIFSIFCSGPMIIILLLALRPIGTLVDYLHYSAESGKNDESLPQDENLRGTGDGSLSHDEKPN